VLMLFDLFKAPRLLSFAGFATSAKRYFVC
ncbi:uncharacterized protein METZ01_LOCUS329086, partial [marine metagenome]